MSSDCLDDYHAAPPSPLLALVGMPHLHGALQAAAAAAEPKPRVLSFASDGAYVEAQPVPSGEAANLVLKPGWLHKHTHCIAGAAALLASWDDSTSATGVAAQIGAIRNASGRSRLLLVLVQASGEASPAPPSEERIAALRRACDLEPRSLLVVSADGPPPSLDAASLARGVKVLLEAAAAYYRDEARRARPPKATAPQLAARHHTKRAVFAELSHEPVLAQRHWQLAAEQLRELVRLAAGSGAEADVASSVPLHEVKRVAELAVRRICAHGMTAPQGAAAASRHAEVFDVFRRREKLRVPTLHAAEFAGN
ncbi:hypothetical protein EMIHUDRAFT_459782 [Emiliania huxleyi CCMP1516]|uniref:Uncharacterized protein n=2 Tax=Emiliania huxleyi TaxID=2903 RepID=A0A0D3IJ29_EMIH1|nr:hypothetical protein EMIHUDRAFT_459782 [Emiliania huxleyi CCMP1516]EOD11264.1 hypothetical protein EMIHUDRAFT_459782 [Emiliania huxleyi CCMP1516]|eukprot:XP_005763693.1 hypothetical protein EMIHUDRAFT_459782 [Emiliania huxleyi CCMP1516]